MKERMKKWSGSWWIIAVCGVVLLSSCETTGSGKRTSRQPPGPIRTFEVMDMAGRTTSDWYINNDMMIEPVYRPERWSAIWSSSLFLVELGLHETLSAEQMAEITVELFRELPTGTDLKEIIIPGLSWVPEDVESAQEPGARDGYLFLFPHVTGAGESAYKIETNIPISSIWIPGVYDGYYVNCNSLFYRGIVPGSWSAIMSLNYREDRIIYQGISFPRTAAPLVRRGEAIRPDRNYTKLLEGADSLRETVASMKELQVIASQQTEQETFRRLLKSAFLSEGVYSFLLGNTVDAANALEQASAIELESPETSRFDNVQNLSKVLTTALQINAELAQW